MHRRTAPMAIALTLALLAGAGAQDSKPDQTEPAVVGRAGPGCIVVQTEGSAEKITDALFGLGVTFEYLYSNNLNGVKSIDRYQKEQAKRTTKPGRNTVRPTFNLATLDVWNWAGVKIIPLAHRHTDAELQAAIAACDAFVAGKTPDSR